MCVCVCVCVYQAVIEFICSVNEKSRFEKKSPPNLWMCIYKDIYTIVDCLRNLTYGTNPESGGSMSVVVVPLPTAVSGWLLTNTCRRSLVPYLAEMGDGSFVAYARN